MGESAALASTTVAPGTRSAECAAPSATTAHVEGAGDNMSNNTSSAIREQGRRRAPLVDDARLAEIAHTLRAELHLVRGSGGQTAKYVA